MGFNGSIKATGGGRWWKIAKYEALLFKDTMLCLDNIECRAVERRLNSETDDLQSHAEALKERNKRNRNQLRHKY